MLNRRKKVPRMLLRRPLYFALAFIFACCGLSGCVPTKQPDFSGYLRIAQLATLECTFHNVAEIQNDGSNILFGAINVTYKKAWFEYEGKVNLGVDVSKVKIEGPDANGVVTLALPEAQILGIPDVDESTFSDVYADTGWFASITTEDQTKALETAQAEMRETVENDSRLLAQAKDRAKTLLGQYVNNVGEALGQSYEVKFVDVE